MNKVFAVISLLSVMLLGCASTTNHQGRKTTTPKGNALPFIVQPLNYSSLQSAQEQVTFPVLAPLHVPNGYSLCSVNVPRSPSSDLVFLYFCQDAKVEWQLDEAHGQPGLRLLTVTSVDVATGTTTSITGPITSVSFAGLHGKVQSFVNGKVPEKNLTWQRGTYSFQLTSYKRSLSLKEMELLAASVRLPTDRPSQAN